MWRARRAKWRKLFRKVHGWWLLTLLVNELSYLDFRSVFGVQGGCISQNEVNGPFQGRAVVQGGSAIYSDVEIQIRIAPIRQRCNAARHHAEDKIPIVAFKYLLQLLQIVLDKGVGGGIALAGM